jgi:hypothetical protein
MLRGGVVDNMEVLTPGYAQEAGRDCRRSAGSIILFQQRDDARADLDARFITVAVVGRVLLKNHNIGTIMLKLEALEEAGDGPSNLVYEVFLMSLCSTQKGPRVTGDLRR